MIAKRIPSKASKPRMARLVKYIVAAEGKLDPRSWTRTADYVLCSGTSSRGEKVGGVRVTNCHTDDPAAATVLIEATQAGNTKSTSDKTYHLVFSFPPGEQPSLETLHKIEDELVASIGFSEHQRISAVHIDTDHLHVHVAINKVHPKSFRNVEPYYDKKKLMEACERLELEHGLQRTNHGLTGERTKKEREQASLPEKMAQAEAHSGVETLTGKVTREIAPALKEAKSWTEVHSILAEHGLSIKPRGAGLVIGSGELWSKASSIDRAFSLKALTDKLGPFEKAQTAPKKEYQPRPRQQHISSAALFDQYQAEKLRARVAREKGIDQLRYQRELREHNLKKWHVAQKLFIKATIKAGPKRRAMIKILGIQAHGQRQGFYLDEATERKKLKENIPMPSWADWLIHQAEGGNTNALAVLRSREEKEQEAMRGNSLSVAHPEATPSLVIPRPNIHVNKHGLITYRTNDGGVVVDRNTHLQALKTTTESTALVLELASKRYAGQALIIEGTEQFKKDVARLAAQNNINVRFADPVMEKARKEANPKVPKMNKSNEAEL